MSEDVFLITIDNKKAFIYTEVVKSNPKNNIKVLKEVSFDE